MCTTCRLQRPPRRRRLVLAAVASPWLIALAMTPWRAPQVSGQGPEATSADWSFALVAVAQAKDGAAKAVKYTCPMHPHYIADHPGTCPICGMDLVKVAAAEPGAPSKGMSREIVRIAPETLQSMGIRIAKVEQASFGRSIRSTGMVMANDRLRTILTGRVEGWIEDLRVTAVGDAVKRGMRLFEMFSPELIVSQRDYLAALATRDERRRADVEQRLRSFGLQTQAIQMLHKSRKEMQRVPFFADRDGTISELNVVSGAYVRRGVTIATIQDYSTVWLQVAVAEKDLGLLRGAAKAKVSLASQPGRTISSRIDYIYPTIDPKTRTGQVRLVVDNADGQVRPGSFADVTFEIGVEPRLAVPSEAILQSEAGTFVVVSLGEGRFEPRAIRTGLVSGRWTEVISGLEAGLPIVVSGQFLIDSESSLKEAFGKLQRQQLALGLLTPSAIELAMIDHIVDAALYLHEALVDGYAIEPKQLDAARQVKDALWPAYQGTQLAFVLTDAVAALDKAKAARTETETRAALAALVSALKPWLVEGAPQHYAAKKVQLFEEEGSARLWLQLQAKPANPYGPAAARLLAWPTRSQPVKPAADAKTKPEAKPAPTGHAKGSH
ncbi:MAG: efflux RND transporter periplasmic adaptor subunit [Hyphomicrobiaceae bacterium]